MIMWRSFTTQGEYHDHHGDPIRGYKSSMDKLSSGDLEGRRKVLLYR